MLVGVVPFGLAAGAAPVVDSNPAQLFRWDGVPL